MNIFKSKEIYKRIPDVKPSQNPLRVVRGVYVSGEQRTPIFREPVVHIIDVSSNHADIHDYTSINTYIYNSNDLNIIGLFESGTWEIEEYTSASKSIYNSNDLNILGVVLTSDFTIRSYTTKTLNIYDNMDSLHILSLYFSHGFDIEDIEVPPENTYKSNPNTSVHILSYTSSNLVIS